MTNQTKNNNLNQLIDPIFIKATIFLVLLLEKENDTNSLPKYYLGNVQIEDVDVLIQQGKTKNKKNFQICVPLKYF